MIKLSEVVLTESKNIPSEGIFWIVENEIIGISEEVPQLNYEYGLKGVTHENIWHQFSNEYKVNGYKVPFNYFPRGRIMVDPNLGNGKFINYSVLIFLDKCVDTQYYREMIVRYYNLDLKSCGIPMWLSLKERTGINHYTCHNCENKDE